MSKATETRDDRIFNGSRGLRALPFVVIAAVGLFASLTFFWFISPHTQTVESVSNADAVVVFVGADDRVDTAVQLINRGIATNLVIPNGMDVEAELCEGAPFQVFCPPSNTIDTRGEAQVIARLAQERGWSNLVAVTSEYHIHRATYQLRQCFDGSVRAVAAVRDLDRDDFLESIVHEWAGTLAAMTFQRAC